MRAFRTRTQSRYDRDSRATGKVKPAAQINANKPAPAAAVQAGHGEKKSEVITGSKDPYKHINLDPDKIEADDGAAATDKVIEPREMQLPVVGEDGQTRTMKVTVLSTPGKPSDDETSTSDAGIPDKTVFAWEVQYVPASSGVAPKLAQTWRVWDAATQKLIEDQDVAPDTRWRGRGRATPQVARCY